MPNGRLITINMRGRHKDISGCQMSVFICACGTKRVRRLGIVMGEWPLDSFEKSIVLSILGECALAMQNEKVTREKSCCRFNGEKRTAKGKFASFDFS